MSRPHTFWKALQVACASVGIWAVAKTPLRLVDLGPWEALIDIALAWSSFAAAYQLMLGPPTLRSLRIRRFWAYLTPDRGLARCFHCRMPWGKADRAAHLLPYQLPGHRVRAVGLTCEWCWTRLSHDERIGYLRHLLRDVWSPWPMPGTRPFEECDEIFEQVSKAIEAGAGWSDSSPEGARS